MKTSRIGIGWLAAALLAGAATGRAGERMQWFNDAKFGMFIHWGLYAVPAGEWEGKTNYAEWFMKETKMPSAQYEKFAAQFNPVKFDAARWAAVAKQAGMKYLVITSKHHDGFCMYDTKRTDYNIVKATPYARDPMKALSAACRAAGLTFCFYYSIADWHHPDSPARYSQGGFHGAPNPEADVAKYATYMREQVRELLTNYGPIGILWFDGGGAFRGPDRVEVLQARQTADLIHRLQPACLINARLGVDSDYGTPEQKIPGGKQKEAFEVCMTLNKHWGYNKNDRHWKEPPEVIQKLADIASKGGNFLLNVGPTAEGEIPPDSVRILGEVGKWMDVNGESIYGTVASPFEAEPAWGRITSKPGRLYLHVFAWPKEGGLLAPCPGKPKKAWLLADRAQTALKAGPEGAQWRLALPAQAPDASDSVVVLDVE